jgi:hypothetical protein
MLYVPDAHNEPHSPCICLFYSEFTLSCISACALCNPCMTRKKSWMHAKLRVSTKVHLPRRNRERERQRQRETESVCVCVCVCVVLSTFSLLSLSIYACVRVFFLATVYVIGGDGSHRACGKVYDEAVKRKLKMSVVGIPKTIDNDIGIIDRSACIPRVWSSS